MPRTRTRIAAAALAIVGAAGLTIGTAASAEAAPSRVFPLTNCINVSPNIVDLPYNPTGVIVSQYRDRTYFAIQYSSIFGYDSEFRIDWHNKRTNKRGSILGHNRVSPPYQGTHQTDLPTATIGRGAVDVRVSTTNRNALWAIPARSCGGSIIVP